MNINLIIEIDNAPQPSNPILIPKKSSNEDIRKMLCQLANEEEFILTDENREEIPMIWLSPILFSFVQENESAEQPSYPTFFLKKKEKGI